jgi:hypothetical protein
MKILTTNYITCAVKACKTSSNAFPLQFRDAELVQEELELNEEFIKNILPRIEWPALVQTAASVGSQLFQLLPLSCLLLLFRLDTTRRGGGDLRKLKDKKADNQYFSSASRPSPRPSPKATSTNR